MKSTELGEQSFYIAIVLSEASSDAEGYKPLYEETFVLIKALSLDEARAKVLDYASQQQVTYQNENGEIIRWSLKSVIDVSPVLYDGFEDETELYARHFRNYEAYRSFEPLLLSEESKWDEA
jgi:hypothetical protein